MLFKNLNVPTNKTKNHELSPTHTCVLEELMFIRFFCPSWRNSIRCK